VIKNSSGIPLCDYVVVSGYPCFRNGVEGQATVILDEQSNPSQPVSETWLCAGHRDQEIERERRLHPEFANDGKALHDSMWSRVRGM
jgi:hypothetical protein